MAEWTANAYCTGCVSKRGYDTKTKARAALHLVRSTSKREGWDGSRLNMWRCGFCRLWHVGHNNTVTFTAGTA